MNDASSYFNANWKRYQSAIANNTLFHKEMGEAFKQFLKQNKMDAFTMVDVGCGDSSTMLPLLAQANIKNYIGIDAAPDVLQMAEKNMAAIPCKKEFICDNMINAIVNIPSSIDIIYTSCAVHHLSSQEKFNFIQNAQHKLKQDGYLIMIDGVLANHQTRDEWIDALAQRMKQTLMLTEEELELRLQHPRAADYPESIETFEKFAQTQQWKSFNVLVDKGIVALMVFGK
ncbi:MAG: class I SAM-dependent methyltransferase [Gammaproteobacteria bacterium]|nr:class I SAM-dependent methyltransferase [Gammaproteobacteria bacterium]